MLSEKNIDIASVIGARTAIIQENGLDLAKSIIDNKMKFTKFILDFSNLDNATTGFFHALIGNLKKDFKDDFNSKISVIGLEKNIVWKYKYDDAIDMASNPEKCAFVEKLISELF